jgi:hypothetical protein
MEPAHLDFGLPSTFVNLFSGLETGELFGDVTQEFIGPGFSGRRLKEQSTAFGLNLTRHWLSHLLKFGWDGQRTRVNGTEGTQIFDLVLATVDDFARYDLENAGVHATLVSEGLGPAGDSVHLRNTYNGLFAQDDWKLSRNITLNLGVGEAVADKKVLDNAVATTAGRVVVTEYPNCAESQLGNLLRSCPDGSREADSRLRWCEHRRVPGHSLPPAVLWCPDGWSAPLWRAVPESQPYRC